MKKLLKKDFSLSINPFFSIGMPLLTGVLFLIPDWVYFVALLYFIWITIPNFFATCNAQRDNEFTLILPVSKKEIVRSRITSIILLESAHILTAIVFAIINSLLFGLDNFAMNLNAAFFGLALLMYGLFNIVFFPLYYRTAYKYGFPMILGMIAAMIFMVLVEFLAIGVPSAAKLLEGQGSVEKIFQRSLLGGGFILFILLNWLTIKMSVSSFEKVDL